jgi:hypothetical protein
MLFNRESLLANRRWLSFCMACTLAALVWYAVEASRGQRWPGGSSRPGLVFGIAAGGIIVFELMLWPRKRLRTWRVGRAQTWLRAHIWLGLLSVPLVVLHSGLDLGGHLSAVLSVTFLIVIASGIWGLALQQYLPRYMLDRVPSETVYWEIESIAAQNYETAAQVVLAVCGPTRGPGRSESPTPPAESHVAIPSYRAIGRTRGTVVQTYVPTEPVANSEVLRNAFKDSIEPYLQRGGLRSSNVLANEVKAARFFNDLRVRLDKAAHWAVDEIEELVGQRRQFDLQVRIHHWLHGWLLIHAPLSIMLLTLLLVHIYVALKYW